MRELILQAQQAGVDGDRLQAAVDREDEDAIHALIAAAIAQKEKERERDIPVEMSGLDEETKKALLAYFNRGLMEMNEKIQKVIDDVAALKSVTAGVPALIQGIKDTYEKALDEARKANPGVDLSALDGVSADIEAATQTLTDAVKQGTVADTAAPPADNGVANAPDHETPVGGEIPTPAIEDPPADSNV